MQRFTSFHTPGLKLVHVFYLLLYKNFVYFVRLRSGINMQTAHQSLGDLTLRLPD